MKHPRWLILLALGCSGTAGHPRDYSGDWLLELQPATGACSATTLVVNVADGRVTFDGGAAACPIDAELAGAAFEQHTFCPTEQRAWVDFSERQGELVYGICQYSVAAHPLTRGERCELRREACVATCANRPDEGCVAACDGFFAECTGGPS
ncbi:MAG: hypothetical protein ACOY0T_37785 [Myxococcota bacterium]